MAKSVLITGCSSGIGAALAHKFQQRGLTVFASARKVSSLSSLSDLPNVHIIALDVTSDSSVQQAYEQVRVKTGGKLDYLVNNAGMGYNMPALDIPIEEAKRLFETNFWGALRMIQTFSPLLIKAKGSIVNISSALAVAHGPYSSIYNASKAAMNLLSETLRLEIAPFGVKVVTVVTGAIATPFLSVADQQLPPDSLYHPIEKGFKAISTGDDGRSRTPVEKYAEDVVSDVLGGATGKTWRGSQAGLARLGYRFFPTWLMDQILLQNSGLSGWKP